MPPLLGRVSLTSGSFKRGRPITKIIFMAPVRVTEWRKLPISLSELCIETSLRCGQSFRWVSSSSDMESTVCTDG